MADPRFERHLALFGEQGQSLLRDAHITIVGCNGLGSQVAQQTALIGVGRISAIEPGDLKSSSRNRNVASWHSDVIPGTTKLEVAARMVELIDPTIEFLAIQERLETANSFEAIKSSDFVFGCLDGDGPRFILNELCLAYGKPLFDLATDVPSDEKPRYGGRLAAVYEGRGCLVCMGVIDLTDARRYLTSDGQLENEAAIYGVVKEHLSPDTGPSVAPINGVVASIGITEFMVSVTGMRKPARILNYRGEQSVVGKSIDKPATNCLYCNSVYLAGAAANVERYIDLFK